MFRTFAAASVALTLISSAAFGSQSLLDNEKVHGRTIAAIKANLSDYYGIEAEYVEEAGDRIVVLADDPDGKANFLFVDKDTLRPIIDSPAVASRLDTTSEESQPADRRLFEEARPSLTWHEDDREPGEE
jgi:hypothetical protein